MNQVQHTRRGAYAAASFAVAALIESGRIERLNFDEQCGAIDCVRDEFLDLVSCMDAVPAYAWSADNPMTEAARLHRKFAGKGCEFSGRLPLARISDALFTACTYTFKFTDV